MDPEAILTVTTLHEVFDAFNALLSCIYALGDVMYVPAGRISC